MYATIFLIALLLAILAHIKLYMLTTSMNGAFALVSDRIKALSNDVRHVERSLDIVRRGPVLVAPAKMEAPLQAATERVNEAEISTLLQVFYGLPVEARDAVCVDLHNMSPQNIKLDCKSSRAADLQSVLRTYDRTTFDVISKTIFAASVLKKSPVVKVENAKEVALEVPTIEQPVVVQEPMAVPLGETAEPVGIVKPAEPVGVDVGVKEPMQFALDSVSDSAGNENAAKSKTSGRKPRKVKKVEKSD